MGLPHGTWGYNGSSGYLVQALQRAVAGLLSQRRQHVIAIPYASRVHLVIRVQGERAGGTVPVVLAQKLTIAYRYKARLPELGTPHPLMLHYAALGIRVPGVFMRSV